ncbi:L-rhamnose-binding lectin CSL3-like [Centroberyx gerrardi]
MRLTTIALLAAAWCLPTEADLLYDVACPGVNNELKCPKGHMIKVTSITSGAQHASICAARHQQAPVARANCFHAGMLPWIKSVCNDWEYCRLPKPNSRMFICNYTPETFMQVSYMCQKKSDDLRTIVACEGETAKVKCDKGVIKVKKANYGRLDNQTCLKHKPSRPTKMTFCMSYSATATVEYMCNGKQKCDFNVKTEILGVAWNCDKNPKYLKLHYVCQ